MPLQIALQLGHHVFAPGEPVRPALVIANKGTIVCDAPVLDGTGHYFIELSLTDPAGNRRTFSLPNDMGLQPPKDHGSFAPLPPGYDIMRTLEIADSSAPGDWELSAVLKAGSDILASNSLKWHQEAQGSLFVIAPAYRGLQIPGSLRGYFQFRGKHLNALYSCALKYDDENASDTLTASEPERLMEMTPSAHSLCAGAGAPCPPQLRSEWLAWLDGGEVHTAIEMFGLQRASCPLPFEPSAIVAAIVTAGNFLEVLVADEDRKKIALVRFAAPEPVPVPTEAPSIEVESAGDDQDQEEDDDSPLFPVNIRPPQVTWTLPLEQPAAGIAFAAGTGKQQDMRALCLVTQQSDGVEVRFSALDSDQPSKSFASILIAGGSALQNCEPVMNFDSSGNAHIALLLNSITPEGRPTTLVARTSFDRNGRPRLDSGTIYHENAETPGEPRGGAISLYVDDNGGPWYIDWCVLLNDNTCVASSRIATAGLKTVPATICRPPQLLSFHNRFYLTSFRNGRPAFIDCV